MPVSVCVAFCFQTLFVFGRNEARWMPTAIYLNGERREGGEITASDLFDSSLRDRDDWRFLMLDLTTRAQLVGVNRCGGGVFSVRTQH
ncbi:uncharacterized protein J3D65DRAFT_637636 [Phyllosticta citribraziliensis]|uniref:Uncharacterized protein n=1 Tax=Phyllosticta citribraziliensis TaxID=989973 RepID=A0ABR1L875_9PEZI